MLSSHICMLGLAVVMTADLQFQQVVLDDSYVAYERDVGDLDGDVDLLVGGMTRSQHRGLRLLLNGGDPDIVGIRNWHAAPTWIYRNDARKGMTPHG